MRQSLKIWILVCISIVSVSLCSNEAYGQKISLKTNALAWGALSPNIGFEVVTGERTSVDLMVMGHIKPYGFDSQMFTVQPEFRFWISGRPMIHTFIGVTAIAATYDMVLRGQVRDGNAFGLGLTFGYVLPLSKKWNIEFSGGLGFVSFFQKQYPVQDRVDHFVNIPTEINSTGYKMLPIDLGITFTYIIK